MYNYPLSLVMTFIALVCVVSSYFVKKKSTYLLFQWFCCIFLIAGYFFSEQFFAMVGLGIGLVRSSVFLIYERKDKVASVWWAVGLSTATVASYFIVNLWILGDAQPLDILCVIALASFAFIFRIRNLKLVRFLMLPPTVCSILFNLLTHAALFATLTYVFELGANIVSIFKYHVFGNKKETQSVSEGEATYEND